MPKYDVYTKKEARELLRYLPDGATVDSIGDEWVYGYPWSHKIKAPLVHVAYYESNGHLPPGSTAAIAGMVDGDYEKVVTDIGCCGSGTIVRPPRYGENSTHLLIEVSK